VLLAARSAIHGRLAAAHIHVRFTQYPRTPAHRLLISVGFFGNRNRNRKRLKQLRLREVAEGSFRSLSPASATRLQVEPFRTQPEQFEAAVLAGALRAPKRRDP